MLINVFLCLQKNVKQLIAMVPNIVRAQTKTLYSLFNKLRAGIIVLLNKVKGVLNPNFRPFSFKLKKKLDIFKWI